MKEVSKQGTITDVPGVKVGHVTYGTGEIQTGITAILPHGGNLFQEKVVAAAHVINGFGKSSGLIQINELGTLESPILLTNTLSVGRVMDGLVGHMLDQNSDIGVTTGTINPVVLECNDGRLNDIRHRFFTRKDVDMAIESAQKNFAEGSVGGGRGMVCYGFKGGIGSSSRSIYVDGCHYHLGVLVQTNFGRMEQLTIYGDPVGLRLAKILSDEKERDQGSIIVVLATDAPLSHRGLLRLCKRVQSGIARTGGITANGSGEVVVAFSTAQKIPHYGKGILEFGYYTDEAMDTFFTGVIEGTEEAILRSLFDNETVTGVRGKKIWSLEQSLNYLEEKELL